MKRPAVVRATCSGLHSSADESFHNTSFFRILSALGIFPMKPSDDITSGRSIKGASNLPFSSIDSCLIVASNSSSLSGSVLRIEDSRPLLEEVLNRRFDISFFFCVKPFYCGGRVCWGRTSEAACAGEFPLGPTSAPAHWNIRVRRSGPLQLSSLLKARALLQDPWAARLAS